MTAFSFSAESFQLTLPLVVGLLVARIFLSVKTSQVLCFS